jgi:hypothetical protein
MSLVAFQHALGTLVADRAFCQVVREGADAALAGRDLCPREVRRLEAIANAPGMRASGTLYRLNRIMPLQRCIPRTLEALRQVLPALIDKFWRAYPETRLQFEEEVARFAAFIESQIARGLVITPLASDMLAFEVAACRLLFRNGDEAAAPPAMNGAAKGLHPLVAVVRFQMEPAAALAGAANQGSLGEHYVVLDARGPELRATEVPVVLGRVLMLVQTGADVPGDAACCSAREAGWLLG